MADAFSIESLLLLARQHQSNPALLARPITDKQLKAVHAKLHAVGVTLGRTTKLEVLREILGYRDPFETSKDLTMADGFGILGLSDQDFSSLVLWASLKLEQGVMI
ncbi:MAG: hypothetical protein ACRD2L_06500 [Terriglobia bacterium]